MISKLDNSKITKLIWRHENNIAHGLEPDDFRLRGRAVEKAPRPLNFNGLHAKSIQVNEATIKYNRESSQTNSNLQASFEGSFISFGSASGAFKSAGKVAKECIGKPSFSEKLRCFIETLKKPFTDKGTSLSRESIKQNLDFINPYLEDDNLIKRDFNKVLSDLTSEEAYKDEYFGKIYKEVATKLDSGKIIMNPSLQQRLKEILLSPYQLLKGAKNKLLVSKGDKTLRDKRSLLEEKIVIIAQANDTIKKIRIKELKKEGITDEILKANELTLDERRIFDEINKKYVQIAETTKKQLDLAARDKELLERGFSPEKIKIGEVDEKIKLYLKNVSFDSFRKIITGYGSNASLTANRIISGTITSTFLAADAYNLTRYLTDDDNKSKKEARIRFKQEMGRVGLTAYLTYAVSTLFKEACNASLPFALFAGFSVLLVSEVYGRKFAGKPVLPISKEKADEYNRKKTEKNLPIQDKVMIAAKGLLGMERPMQQQSNDVFVRKSQNYDLNQFINNSAMTKTGKNSRGGNL